jgi:hypothetical protein
MYTLIFVMLLIMYKYILLALLSKDSRCDGLMNIARCRWRTTSDRRLSQRPQEHMNVSYNK